MSEQDERKAAFARAQGLFDEIQRLPDETRELLHAMLSEWWCNHCGGDRPCYCMDDD